MACKRSRVRIPLPPLNSLIICGGPQIFRLAPTQKLRINRAYDIPHRRMINAYALIR